jgi:hypothetical protein
MLNPPHHYKKCMYELIESFMGIDPCYDHLIFVMSLKHDIYVHVFPRPTTRREEGTNLFKGQ